MYPFKTPPATLAALYIPGVWPGVADGVLVCDRLPDLGLELAELRREDCKTTKLNTQNKTQLWQEDSKTTKQNIQNKTQLWQEDWQPTPPPPPPPTNSFPLKSHAYETVLKHWMRFHEDNAENYFSLLSNRKWGVNSGSSQRKTHHTHEEAPSTKEPSVGTTVGASRTASCQSALTTPSDHTRHFSNQHDIYKVAKMVCRNRSDNHRNRSDARPCTRKQPAPFPD